MVGSSSIQKVNQYTEALDLTENKLAYVKEHTDSQYGDILYFSLKYYYEETIEEVILLSSDNCLLKDSNGLYLLPLQIEGEI